MNFELSDEQKLIQHTAREFARREILPVAAQCDREASFPMEVAAKAREVGVTNMTVPNEYGGSGWGVLEQILVGEELAWACAGHRRRAGAERDLRRRLSRRRLGRAEEGRVRPDAGR